MAKQPQGESPKARPCPICGRPSETAHRPFCSPRCADVDLNRWLSNAYVIPGEAPDHDSGDGGTPFPDVESSPREDP